MHGKNLSPELEVHNADGGRKRRKKKRRRKPAAGIEAGE
jgi:hypothetical protein